MNFFFVNIISTMDLLVLIKSDLNKNFNLVFKNSNTLLAKLDINNHVKHLLSLEFLIGKKE